VPASLGGGGGVWGWGGTSFSPSQNALFAVTATAFPGGTNTGSAFSESAGYGEHLVELDPSLNVVASNHPSDISEPEDLDFFGAPVVLDRAGCGELVVAADKNDEVYAWRADDVADGPVWSISLEQFDAANPLLSQLAWSPSSSSVYAVTGTQLARISIGANCAGTVTWTRPLGTDTENGSPTISGTTLWFAINGKPQLVAYDARTGERLTSLPLGGTTLVAPTVIDGRLVVGTFTGLIEGFSIAADRSVQSAGTSASTASEVSSASTKDAWETRAAGVFATENGGRSWQQIYAAPALAMLRLSADLGVIELGTAPSKCMCTTRHLWTDDDGQTWHLTDAISQDFTGGGGSIYWWEGGTLQVISPFPKADDEKPLDARVATSLPDGTILGGARTPDGFAFLVSNRVSGQHWDTNPRVILADGGSVETVRLPSAPAGEILAESITESGGALTVTATDFGTDPVSAASRQVVYEADWRHPRLTFTRRWR
jgi:hypothetical protein